MKHAKWYFSQQSSLVHAAVHNACTPVPASESNTTLNMPAAT